MNVRRCAEITRGIVILEGSDPCYRSNTVKNAAGAEWHVLSRKYVTGRTWPHGISGLQLRLPPQTAVPGWCKPRSFIARVWRSNQLPDNARASEEVIASAHVGGCRIVCARVPCCYPCYSNGSCARDSELLPIGLCPRASIEPLRPRSRMTESRGWTWT